MPLNAEKLLALQIPDVEHSVRPEGLHALCARPRSRPGPAQRRRARLRLRKKSQGAADLRRDAGLRRLLAAAAGDRRHLGEGGAWRAGPQAARAGRAAGHGDRPHPHPRRGRQGRRQGRADLFRTPDQRQGERPPARNPDSRPRSAAATAASAAPNAKRRRRMRYRRARPMAFATCRPGRKWR